MLGRLYSWYGKFVVRVVLGLIVLLVVAGVILSQRGTEETVQTDEAIRSVEVQTVAELEITGTVAGVGVVEAVNEAALVSEVSGRITSVPVTLGDRVNAGTVIAETENASERAAVLQAQGVYEAAVAGAAQSDTGVASAEVTLRTAQTSGINSYRSAFITAEDVVRNTIDTLFSSPTGNIPGFRLDAIGDAVEINEMRSQVEGVLTDWSAEVSLNPATENAHLLLEEAESDLLTISHFVQRVSESALNEENDDATIGATPIETIRADVIAARTDLNTALQDVRDAHERIENAENALRRAQIGGTGEQVSAANAQVKQALGSLRAAEANLAKTIIRAPFPGTVNSLSVKVGDAVSPGSPIALIANNNALEITTFVGEEDRALIQVGDRVSIEGGVFGIVTKIAPAIDPTTGKIEVKIGIDDTSGISNGDTVRISFEETVEARTDSGVTTLPLRALKITPSGPVVFTVSDSGTLVAHPVDVGSISGDSITVLSGLNSDTAIVTDARGLKEGDLVSVTE